LDYTKIKKIEAQAPEGYEGEGAEGEEAEEDPETGELVSKPRNELITIAGRVYREESMTEPGQFKWIYERWNKVTTSAQHPDIIGTIAGVCRSADEEMKAYQ
jgi:hypothetical protein